VCQLYTWDELGLHRLSLKYTKESKTRFSKAFFKIRRSPYAFAVFRTTSSAEIRRFARQDHILIPDECNTLSARNWLNC